MGKNTTEFNYTKETKSTSVVITRATSGQAIQTTMEE